MNSMKYTQKNIGKPIIELVHEYEVLSQKGTVGKFEKTVLCDIADYYEQEAAFEKALNAIDHALSVFGLSIDLIIKKINILIKNSKGVDAIEYLDFKVNPNMSEPRIQLLKAKVLISLKNYEDAFPILEELKFEHTFSNEILSEVFLCEAGIYESLFQFEKMYYALQESILLNPKNNDALIRMWLCVEINKKYEESIHFHKSIIEEAPFSYLAWFNLGHAFHYKRNYKKAIEAFEYAFLINPDFELAYRDCADVCMDICQFDKALECYVELRNRIGDESELYLNMGICYERMNDDQSAKALYFKSISLDSHNDEAYYRVGTCFLREEMYELAIHYLQKAIQLEERREEYFAALGNVYSQIGDHKNAVEAFEAATEVAPEIPIYWVQFASYYMSLFDYDSALEVIEQAEIHAVGAEIFYCKAACLFNQNNRSEALTAMEEALIDNFNMHPLIFDFDKSLRRNKDVRAIVRYYRGEQDFKS